VAAEKLRQRVHDDVGAVLDRLAQIGRGQRVVDDERHAGALGDRPTASISVITPPGLAIDSMKIALVFGLTRARTFRCRRDRPRPRSSRNS
jgi:hypothetical protein